MTHILNFRKRQTSAGLYNSLLRLLGSSSSPDPTIDLWRDKTGRALRFADSLQVPAKTVSGLVIGTMRLLATWVRASLGLAPRVYPVFSIGQSFDLERLSLDLPVAS